MSKGMGLVVFVNLVNDVLLEPLSSGSVVPSLILTEQLCLLIPNPLLLNYSWFGVSKPVVW